MVDARGAVAETVYDELGNVTKSVRFALRPTSLTTYTESAITAATESLRSDPNNQVTRYAYDRDTRLRFTVDALGSVSETQYDALGNVTATVRFAERPTNLADYAEGTLAAAVESLRSDLNNQVSRLLYDAAGRLTHSVQAVSVNAQSQVEYQVSKQEYNALGQLIRSRAYATTVVLSTFSQSAIEAAEVGAASDRRTLFVYDAAGQQRFEVQADQGAPRSSPSRARRCGACAPNPAAAGPGSCASRWSCTSSTS